MNGKLTPRQNEIISEALAQYALQRSAAHDFPEQLKRFREALMAELTYVAQETAFSSYPDLPSISG